MTIFGGISIFRHCQCEYKLVAFFGGPFDIMFQITNADTLCDPVTNF